MTRLHLQLALRSSPSTSEWGVEEEEEEEEGYEEEDDYDGSESGYEEGDTIQFSSPLIVAEERERQEQQGRRRQQQQQFSFLAVLLAALRKSLVTCRVDPGEDVCSSMDIGWPTDVRHIAHVTFDRFNGFLGLPVELEPEVAGRVPSASASVFGVSANSMQCSFDTRGNSVPSILLLMQKRLYTQGGLQVEGIFRINAENGQEVYVRNQLNKGIVPEGVDMHCLAGLIKAWFRELPKGILDSITPDQVMHCNTEDECSELVRILPPMEAALLDWAINLMADVVQNECHNKMNARNIAMVFAPNMTQMADPLTALIHAVQVMNLLKTLILKTLREREEEAADLRMLLPVYKNENNFQKTTEKFSGECMEKKPNGCFFEGESLGKIMRRNEQGSQSDAGDSFHSFGKRSEADEEQAFTSGNSSPIFTDKGSEKNAVNNRYGNRDEGFLGRFSFKGGARKLCWHPVFHLSKSIKKPGDVGVVNSNKVRKP